MICSEIRYLFSAAFRHCTVAAAAKLLLLLAVCFAAVGKNPSYA
jgi:hypothetical protein